jgi:hypothetical protein
VPTREQWKALTDEFRAAFIELTKIEATVEERALPTHDQLLHAAQERLRIAREKISEFRSRHSHLVD